MDGRNFGVGGRVASLIGLTVPVVVMYYGVRWLMTALDPTSREKDESKKRAQKLMKDIGVPNAKLTEYELCIAADLVDPLSMVTTWHDIGGLEETVQEMRETVIVPFQRRKLFKGSNLLRAPKGVLLFGPPGCGKTMIARATAKEANARFINLQITNLVDKWYGEPQKRTAAIFSLARKIQPVIIFIDEIDAFLRSRASMDHESTTMMKTQFMSFWDGLLTDDDSQIMIMGATNRPGDVDAAILRRMPSRFHVKLPDINQREKIFEVILRGESLSGCVALKTLATKTDGMSGSDLREVCRQAAVCRIRELCRSHTSLDGDDSELRSMTMADFLGVIDKVKYGHDCTS